MSHEGPDPNESCDEKKKKIEKKRKREMNNTAST